MSEEWGPWIEHDGKGCPCRGMMVMVVFGRGAVAGPVIAGSRFKFSPEMPDGSWLWSNADIFGIDRITQYRIRKPRALIEMRDMIADLPTPAERVDA